MPKYGLIACDGRFIKARHWVDMLTEREIKNWEFENGKKSGVLALQKVAKTGNIEKKSSGSRYQLFKIPHQHRRLKEMFYAM